MNLTLKLHPCRLLLLCNTRKEWHCHLSYALLLALEGCQHFVEKLLHAVLVIHRPVFVLAHRRLNGKRAQNLHLEAVVIIFRIVIHHVFHTVIEGIDNVGAYALAYKGMPTTRVYHVSLRVHHIIVFEQMLTNTEIVLLHTLLGVLYGIGHHLRLYRLAIVQAHAVQ